MIDYISVGEKIKVKRKLGVDIQLELGKLWILKWLHVYIVKQKRGRYVSCI